MRMLNPSRGSNSAVPASTPENTATELLLAHMTATRAADMLELVIVDRGVSERAASNLSEAFGVEVRQVGWDEKSSEFRPIAHA